ncbi:hypothetical protein IMCC3317_15700 [Kordia antarctica]|uniref:Uncharacterized protein n=1 Tax=Kordia antarctica TaxID=1218801 RepID=A0A7L4ZI93_9FLAO|nr:hypothetical protein [Kordia antarctica]QHI36211.1 hypothetical protein IMCC3317_15700 [Kordia antarctica]
MKTINLKNTQQISRSEMREIIAGFGNAPSLMDETATVTCNDNTEHTISSCDEMEVKCATRGGAKICSGGGN